MVLPRRTAVLPLLRQELAQACSNEAGAVLPLARYYHTPCGTTTRQGWTSLERPWTNKETSVATFADFQTVQKSDTVLPLKARGTTTQGADVKNYIRPYFRLWCCAGRGLMVLWLATS